MGKMIRKQIYLEPEQDELLKQEARKSGLSEAELIRRAIDEVVKRSIRRERAIQAWEREEEFIRKHRMFDVPQTTDRGWTREELYEDRFKRWE